MKPYVIPGGVLEIQHAVAKHFRITREDICSNNRGVQYDLPRQIATYLAVKRTGRSRNDIALLFGDCSRTTISRRVRIIEKDLAIYAAVIASIEAALDKSMMETSSQP